jgi:hypothetical protein
LLHGIPSLGHAVEHFAEGLGWAGGLVNMVAGGLAGLLAGAAAVAVFNTVQRVRGSAPSH